MLQQVLARRTVECPLGVMGSCGCFGGALVRGAERNILLSFRPKWRSVRLAGKKCTLVSKFWIKPWESVSFQRRYFHSTSFKSIQTRQIDTRDFFAVCRFFCQRSVSHTSISLHRVSFVLVNRRWSLRLYRTISFNFRLLPAAVMCQRVVKISPRSTVEFNLLSNCHNIPVW